MQASHRVLTLLLWKLGGHTYPFTTPPLSCNPNPYLPWTLWFNPNSTPSGLLQLSLTLALTLALTGKTLSLALKSSP